METPKVATPKLDNPELKDLVNIAESIEVSLDLTIASVVTTYANLHREKEDPSTPFARQREIAADLAAIDPWLRERGWLMS